MKIISFILTISLFSMISLNASAFAPISLKIMNNTGVDIQAQVVDSAHIDERDISTLEKNTIYGGKSALYLMNRTDSPARLVIRFRVALEEGQMSGYGVGQWEYIEYSPDLSVDAGLPSQGVYLADTCHNTASENPYVVSCQGNDSLMAPTVTVTLDNQKPN